MAQVKDTWKGDITVGMDQDSFGSEATKGSWFYALNVLFYSGLQGKNKISSHAIGNIEIENDELPVLDWKCIWEKTDRQSNYLYFCLKHAASSTYMIWRLVEDDQFELVLNNINLNVRANSQTKGVVFVDGLLFTSEGIFTSFENGIDGQPQYSNPKGFIIEKAVRYTASGGGDPLGYPSIDFQTLSALKFPPPYSPTFEYTNDPTFTQNFLWRQAYQFMYRYVYDDKSKSLFSSYSQLACILNNEFMDGKNAFEITTANTLTLTINSGHHTATDIEIAVQIGNTGIWGIFKKINKAEAGLANGVDFQVEFKGNESQEVVPSVDLFNYDLLPDVSKCIEYTTANTIVHSNIWEGRTNPEMELSAEWVHNKIFVPAFGSDSYVIALLAPGDTTGVFSWEVTDLTGIVIFPLSTVSLPVGTAIVFKVSLASDCATGGITDIEYITYVIQEGDFTGANDEIKLDNMLDNMALFFTVAGYESERGNGPIPGYGDPQCIGFRCRIVISTPTTAVSTAKYKTFKQGCFHKFSAVYKGLGQKDGFVTTDAFEIYLPYGNETLPSGYTAYEFYQTLMRMKLINLPPDWAHTWCPVLQERSGMGAQMQRTIQKATAIGSRVRLDFETKYFDTYQATYNYTPEQGDSVRILQISDFVTDTPKWGQDYIDIQLSVVEYLPGGGVNGSDAILVEMFDVSTILSAGTVIEVSKIKKTSDVYPFYELGLEFPILDPGTPERKHGGGYAYFGTVYEAGDLGTSVFKFQGEYSVYQDMAGRSVTMNNALGEEQVLLIDSVVDAGAGVVTINLNDVFLFDYTIGNIGSWKILADQTGGMPAEVLLNGIDVYIRSKTMGIQNASATTGTFIVEDDNISNYYPSQFYDKGRVHVFKSDAEQQHRIALHRGSLPYEEANDINQLNRYVAGEEAWGPTDFGEVQETYMRGETLRVLQEKKVYSIPINRQAAYLPGGGSQYLFSDAQLGRQDEGTGLTGPYSSEASIMIGTDIFYFDVWNKMIMKDTLGGPVPINGKLNQFWITVAKSILTNPSAFDIKFGHSIATKEMFISVWNATTPLASFTLSYCLLTDKWLSFYSFSPEIYLHGNERLFSMNRQECRLWEHNVGTPNNFYGIDYQSILEFYTNEQAEQDKIILSYFAAINSKPASVEVYADITELQPSGVYSNSGSALRNDGYWGNFNMNGLTPGIATQLLALGKGYPCQSPWFKIKITTEEGIAFALRYVDLYFNVVHEIK